MRHLIATRGVILLLAGSASLPLAAKDRSQKTSPKQRALWLTRAEVERAGPDESEVMGIVRKTLARIAKGGVINPAKQTLRPQPDHANSTVRQRAFTAMPAYFTPDGDSGVVGIKWTSGFPSNSRMGLPYNYSRILLNDALTGRILADVDGTWITAERTAGLTAVAAGTLLRGKPTRLAVIAFGLQGQRHTAYLLKTFPSIREVRVFDLQKKKAAAAAERLSKELGRPITATMHPRDAIKDADLVVSSTAISSEPHGNAIQPKWLKAGALVVALDFTSNVSVALQKKAVVVTDSYTQFAATQDTGHIAPHLRPIAEISEVVTKAEPPKVKSGELLIFMPIGLAPLDVALASAVVAQAQKRRIGTFLDP